MNGSFEIPCSIVFFETFYNIFQGNINFLYLLTVITLTKGNVNINVKAWNAQHMRFYSKSYETQQYSSRPHNPQNVTLNQHKELRIKRNWHYCSINLTHRLPSKILFYLPHSLNFHFHSSCFILCCQLVVYHKTCRWIDSIKFERKIVYFT